MLTKINKFILYVFYLLPFLIFRWVGYLFCLDFGFQMSLLLIGYSEAATATELRSLQSHRESHWGQGFRFYVRCLN